MAKVTAAFGIYRHEREAALAVEALRESGFRCADISLLAPSGIGDSSLALDKATKAPEGAVAGASAGAVLGGALGWLAAAGTLAVPGLGPFLAAGPLMALLGGVGAGGAVGGLAGALVGAGIPEYEAKQYEGRLQNGHVLLSVHCDDLEWLNSAREILKRTGAEDISSIGESAADSERGERPVVRADSAAAYEPDFRRDFAINHDDLGVPYADAAALYEFGFRMAKSEQLAGKNFEDAEPILKATHPHPFVGSDWNRISNLVLYGWERAGGKIRQGFALI